MDIKKSQDSTSCATPCSPKIEKEKIEPTPQNEGKENEERHWLDFLLNLLPTSESAKKRKREEMQDRIDEAARKRKRQETQDNLDAVEAMRCVETLLSLLTYLLTST